MNKPLLEVRNISKMYGSHRALNNVLLTLYKGEIVSLLGVNGAGKTTLSSILATLKPPSGGDILFDGCSIYNNIPEYRRKLGYCPQRPNLHPQLTMRDNLIHAGRYFGMSEDAIAVRMKELQQHLGIKAFLDAYVDMLSGGWKQRYLIARTLMHSPQFVIFDEPTVALDPSVRRQLWEYIKLIRDAGTCVLLTTHYIDEAEYLSDRVVVLDAGVVKFIDTPAHLMSTHEKGNLEDVFIHLTQSQEE